MPLYEFTAEIDDSVFGEDAYDAMGAIEQKIKNGDVTPEQITIQKEENGEE
jgi:hypothetical protein